MICHMGNKTVLNTINDCLDHGNVTLISENVTTPDGLAIDWVHGLLFWTDTGLDTVILCYYYITIWNVNFFL